MKLDQISKQIVSETLKLNNFNRTKTAKQLGISIRTLRNYNHDWKISENDLVKKKKRAKPIFIKNTQIFRKKMFPTLAHIVLNNGYRVDIPKLPFNISVLTSCDNLKIALEHAALAICCLNRLESRRQPILILSNTLDHIRMNLEDLLNHLHYAIKDFPEKKGSS